MHTSILAGLAISENCCTSLQTPFGHGTFRGFPTAYQSSVFHSEADTLLFYLFEKKNDPNTVKRVLPNFVLTFFICI